MWAATRCNLRRVLVDRTWGAWAWLEHVLERMEIEINDCCEFGVERGLQ